jgi:LPXTG-motif cell wall-anchored protein
MVGSNGGLLEEHPVTIVIGAVLLLASVWWLLRRR